MTDYADLGSALWASPIGWHRLGPAPQPGEVLSAAVGDRSLVTWRPDDGPVVVADAVCPHLGADLGRGGRIDEDGCLTCPFHGWRYAPDGVHAGTPSGHQVPGVGLSVLASQVIDDEVHAFHGPEGLAPWAPAAVGWAAELAADPPVVQRVTEQAMEAPPAVLAEGAFDLAHFGEVHGIVPTSIDHRFDGAAATMAFTIGEGRRRLRFDFAFDGITSFRERIRRDRYTLRRVFSLHATGGGDRPVWTSRAVSSVSGPSVKAATALLDELEAVAATDLEEDARLWRGRDFNRPCVYGPADRPLREFRAWVRAFVPVAHAA